MANGENGRSKLVNTVLGGLLILSIGGGANAWISFIQISEKVKVIQEMEIKLDALQSEMDKRQHLETLINEVRVKIDGVVGRVEGISMQQNLLLSEVTQIRAGRDR